MLDRGDNGTDPDSIALLLYGYNEQLVGENALHCLVGVALT